MKFRFCGDLDCPNWVLSEIATLSQFTSVRVKVLAVQVLSSALEGTFNHEKVLKLAKNDAEGLSNIKGITAAVHFILTNAARYDLDEMSLTQEIQQLGLPKENAEAMTKLYRAHKDGLREVLSAKSYRMSRFVGSDWRVDRIIASSDADKAESIFHLNVKLDRSPHETVVPKDKKIEDCAFEMTIDQMDLFIHELQIAKEKMVLD
jgi:hypothetical protein